MNGQMVIALLAGGLMLFWPDTVMAAARQACALWAQNVLPGLLPFMICLLYAAGRMTLTAGGRGRLTGLSKGARRIWLMGTVSGSPTGARLMNEGAGRGLLLPGDGLPLALWAGGMSPMFLMGVLPRWLGWPGAGWRLMVSHLAGLWAAGEMARLIPPRPLPKGAFSARSPMTLPQAVEGACRALLSVCGCMIMGCIAGALVQKLCPDLPPLAAAFFQCLTEVTAGCRSLIDQAAPPWYLAGAVSFGGLSLFLQNLAFYPAGWFSALWVLAGRLLAAAVSTAAACLLMSGAAPAFNPGPLPMAQPSPVWLAVYFMLCLTPFVFRKRSTGL